MKVAKIIPALEKMIKEKEEIDGEGCVCSVCTLHEVFKDIYDSIVSTDTINANRTLLGDEDVVVPLCPKCNSPLDAGTAYGYTAGVVGGSNIVDEAEEMQYCQLWHCDYCDQDYAMMPTPIEWNANHDILYTGGAHYLTDNDEEQLLSKIRDKLTASVEQFVRRVRDPKDTTDAALSEWNLNLWMERDITGAVAEFLYEKGYKK